MAISAGICDSYIKELFSGVHTSEDDYYIALYASSATLDSNTTATYTTNGEVVGQGYVAGGQKLTGFSTSLDGNTAILTWANPVWDLTSFTVRGAMIYNSTAGGNAVAIIDFGSDVIASGTYSIIFPEATASTGLIKIQK